MICDKGYAAREFAATVSELGPVVMRPARQTEPDNTLHLSTIRQRIESIFCTCKDLLTLERHGARTITNLYARIATGCLPPPPASPSSTSSDDQAARSCLYRASEWII